MAIRSIAHGQFVQHLPTHHALDQLLGVETDWFASTAQDLIGTVAQRHIDDWGYAMLKRRGDGLFQVRKMKVHIRSREAAVAQLVRVMRTNHRADDSRLQRKR